MARPPAASRRDTAAGIRRAALHEFARHGFDATPVDDIAARARVNKAMIYYHFGSKSGLYRAVLSHEFRRLADTLRSVADSGGTPRQRLDAYAEALTHFICGHPYLAPMILRELAEGARHIDTATMRLMAGAFRALQRILEDGVREEDFQRVDPLLTHLSTIGAVMMFAVSRPVRRRVQARRILGPEVKVPITPAPFVAHLQRTLRRAVAPEGA